ncbi:MAG: alpha/beta hydrolase [Gemmatimonadaceae bacterium]
MTDTRPNSRDIARAPLPPEGPTSRTTAERHTRAGRAARRRPWIAFGLSMVTLFMATWIFVPAPNRTLLPLSVGAPEISPWLVVMAIVAIVGAVRTWRMHTVAKIATIASMVALFMACVPLVRFPAVSKRSVAALAATLGVDYLDAVPFNRQLALRPSPLILSELFRGLPNDSAIVTKNVVFATVEKVPLKAIVYQPPTPGYYPIIVQIYGGAWQRGTADDFAEFARFFAARGYVVFAIDYRHAPQFTSLQQISDVKTALAWVRRSGAKYNADTSRIALLGRSAGAHLAMMTGFDSTMIPVKAVVSFYGPVDLVESYLHPPSPDPLHVRDVEEKFIGTTLERSLDSYKHASPINMVRPGLPPTLLIYGGRDNIVEQRFGAMMHEKLQVAGDTSIFLDIPWADHAFDEVPNGLSGQLSRYVVERFLAWALTRQTP